MFAAVRILVVGERASRAEALAAELRPFNLEIAAAAGFDDALAQARGRAIDAVVIADVGRSPAEIARLASTLKTRAAPRLVVVVAVGDGLDPSRPPAGVDAALAAPAHPAQIAARARLLLRLAVMEDEARLRAATLEARGIFVDVGLDEAARSRVSVLYVGEAMPSYLGIAASLGGYGATLSAAFSTFTAFDFLHERDFDAVLVNARDKLETGLAVCTALRRNTRLFHTPVALIVGPQGLDAAGEAIDKGASELLPLGAGPEDIARRVMSLARERQRRMLVKAAFAQVRAPEVVDVVSGLANAGFFLDHIEAMARRAHRLERPLSMVLVRTVAPHGAPRVDREQAFRQVGAMISRLVRAEDLAAELEPGVFAIAMPGALRASGEDAAQRIAAIAEHTAFGGDRRASSFQVELRCEVAELAAGERARGLLARTIKAFRRAQGPAAARGATGGA